MPYNSKIYQMAKTVLENKREKNQYLLEKRREEITNKLPQYLEVKNKTLSLFNDYMKNSSTYSKEQTEEIKEKIKQCELERKKILKDNGYNENYLESIYDCPDCKDTGYINNKQCDCLIKILNEIAKKESRLSYMIDEQNFEHFNLDIYSDKISSKNDISPKENMKKILSFVKKFIDNFDNISTKSLLFTGSTGVGKTYLSSCIAKKMLDKGKNVLYQSSAKLCEILEEYKFNRENAIYDTINIVRDIYDIDLLIIDDFGTEFKTSYTLTAIFELINSRIVNNKKTIISTNLSIIELKDIYSERLFSRFMGEFDILEFIGEDLRMKNFLNNH